MVSSDTLSRSRYRERRLNNSYFRLFSLLKFIVRLVFVFLEVKNSRSRKTNGSFRFSFSYENCNALP